MRRAVFWTASLVAVIALLGGAAYAYLGYRATSGPGATVRGYFAALARSDAPAALAFGDVPDGPHGLLTSEVLAQQQQIAPLHDVRILDVATAGDEATVRYSYQLRFALGGRTASGNLRVLHRASRWRLAQTAVPVTVRLVQASDRVTFAGSSLPAGRTLLFPGALPLHLDTPYLQVRSATATAQFAGGSTIDIDLELTAAGRAGLIAALTKRLAACASGHDAAPDCPLPSSRVVPSSFAGRITGVTGKKITFRVGTDASGMISMNGVVDFRGRYRELDYNNVVHTHRGRVPLGIAATAYPVAPLAVRFGDGR